MEALDGPDAAVFADLAKVYVAAPDSPLRALLCAECRWPLSTRPFIMYVLVQLAPCQNGYDHLPGGGIVRHLGCDQAGADALAAAAAAAIGRCYSD